MKKTWLFCSMLLLFTLLEAQPFFTVKGKDIIGPDGKPFLMKGTNLGNWLVPEGYMFKFKYASSARMINEVFSELIGPSATRQFWAMHLKNYITREDIKYLRSTGMNSIRIPFHYKLFTDEDYMGGKGEARGFALLDTVIKWCAAENLPVILDMHAAPGGQTGDNIDDSYGYPFIFTDQDDQALIVSIWLRIAEHYKNNRTVMGYDLFNEPIPHYMDTASHNPLLEPLYKKITAAIRTKDRNHIIFLEGAQWASNFAAFGKPFDDKLVYQFHKYWTATTIDVIQPYLDFREKYNIPLYCGETGENDDEWINNFRKLLEQNNIGWHFWPYKKMDNTRGIVSFPKPDGYDAIIAFADTTRTTYEQIRNLRPKDTFSVRRALFLYSDYSRFPYNKPNKGYIEALGLKAN